MKDRSIPDANIRASSEHTGYAARNARHDGDQAWVARSTTNQWIEADIGYLTSVSGIVTQGDGGNGDSDDWVTKLMVSTKLSSDVVGDGIFIQGDNGEDKVCRSN